MARKQKKQAASSHKHGREQAVDEERESIAPLHPKRSAEPIAAKTERQQRYINAIRNFDVVFGLGPAGTGKSWIAAAIAAEMLASNCIEKIVVTRPAVESEEKFGFLPGELAEKYAPYLAPIEEILNERLGKGATQYFIKSGRIEAVPLAFMRGKTFRDSFVLFDEAQNATAGQMKLFLTRIGENCKVVVDGDTAQVDIHDSGLSDAVNRVSHIPCVKVITFDQRDVVRSGFVAEVLAAYS